MGVVWGQSKIRPQELPLAVESCLLPQRGLKGHVLSPPEASSHFLSHMDILSGGCSSHGEQGRSRSVGWGEGVGCRVGWERQEGRREARLGQVSRPNSLTGSGGAREGDVKASSRVCRSGQRVPPPCLCGTCLWSRATSLQLWAW